MASTQFSVAIIGGGIVGLATGLEISSRFPGVSLVILEKEAAVAAHQTGHNSGVIHSGIYYKPGSLKARLCVEGVNALLQFCEEHNIRYERCGKVIVATSQQEIPRLEELYRRGIGNGLQKLRVLSADGIREIEPHATGIQAIHVPVTGIVDYAEVARKYAEVIMHRGGTVRLGCEVVGFRRSVGVTTVETTTGTVQAKLIINCAGLQSDRVSRMAGATLDMSIVPFRGEYYDLVPAKHHLIRTLLYPVPDPRFPFGSPFHAAYQRRCRSRPNAVLALKREGYKKTAFRAKDVMEYATFPGFWIMAAKYGKMGAEEYYRSWSKAAFVRSLQRLLPELTAEDLVPGGSGVRAQALGDDGKLIDDFLFAYTEGVLHVCNVPSPAATASLAIGRHIVDTIVKQDSEVLAPSRASVPQPSATV